MNRESCGYLVKALNQLASLTAQCSFDDVDRPVGPKVQPIEVRRRKSRKVPATKIAIHIDTHARRSIASTPRS